MVPMSNPYAPPKADVQDVVSGGVAPALWNPNAAASWSLLFSPAFGALLQMHNWRALGEPEKAATAKMWAIVSLLVIGGGGLFAMLLPDSKAIDGVLRIIAMALLFGWYFSTGRSQAVLVKARFGKDYPRRGWGKPLGFAVLALLAFMAAAVAVALIAGALGYELQA